MRGRAIISVVAAAGCLAAGVRPVIPAQAGIQDDCVDAPGIPACAGMTAGAAGMTAGAAGMTAGAAGMTAGAAGMTAGAAGMPASPDAVLIPHTSYIIPSPSYLIPPPDPDGRALYIAHCAACHMPDGTGIAGAFPPLAGSHWVTGDERMIVRVVLDGIAGEIEVAGERYDGLMPPFGAVLSDAEIAAVATYVRGSWGNQAAAVSTATVARERTATAGRDGPWTAAQLMAGLEIVK